MDAADQLLEHPVHQTADFLQRLDAFGCDFTCRISRVAVPRGRPSFIADRLPIFFAPG